MPKRAHLQLLEGHPGRRPIRREAHPRALVPVCPDWLLPDAKREWRRVLEDVRDVPDWIVRVDAAALAAYCQSYARWREAEAVLTEQGFTYEALTIHEEDRARGSPEMLRTTLKPRPEVMIAARERAAMLRAAAELGLTPMARARLSLPKATADDEDDPSLDPA